MMNWKLRVYRYSVLDYYYWVAQIGPFAYQFKTWREAMDFAIR